MLMAEFKEIKELLRKTGSTLRTAVSTGWSVRTVQRVKKARSFKQYKELC